MLVVNKGLKLIDNIKIIGKKFYRTNIDYNPRFILKKILSIIFGSKLLNYTGNFLFKIGTKLKNLK
jgi:hypothetical protein